MADSKQAKQEKRVKVVSRHLELLTELIEDDTFDIAKYQNVLLISDEYGSNLLHRLILTLKMADKGAIDDGLPPEKVSPVVLDFVDHLVINKPDLFTQEDGSGVVPLSDAAENKVEILFRVLSLVIPESMRKRITTKRCDKEQKGMSTAANSQAPS